jgi:hypothetical protein
MPRQLCPAASRNLLVIVDVLYEEGKYHKHQWGHDMCRSIYSSQVLSAGSGSNFPGSASLPAEGGAFELESYTCHPHGLFMHGCSSLVDLFQSMNSMRPVLAASSAKRKRFSQELALLAYEHFGNNPFCLPLTTRMYIMRKQGSGEGQV